MAAKFPAKVQSLRVHQRLPLRGSWQSRQALTEGVRSKPPSVKKGYRNARRRFCTPKFKIILPLNMARVQRRRPPPAAETGRSCWGSGQQDASAAQGTRGCWEPQPGALKKSPLGSFLPPAGGRVPSIPRTGCMKKSLILRSGILFMTRTGIEPMLQP